MKRTLFTEEHKMFRDAFRRFVEKEIAPHYEAWWADGVVSREVWLKAGSNGFLGTDVPEVYGGGGIRDYRYNLVMVEELARAGKMGVGFPIHNDIVVPYLLNYTSEAQRQRWLPKVVSGECITAIAMTEPDTGSDLAAVRTTARRDGDHYILNGQKTFISNGILNDLVIVVAKTDLEKGHKGISLLAVERGMPGYERGRNLAPGAIDHRSQCRSRSRSGPGNDNPILSRSHRFWSSHWQIPELSLYAGRDAHGN
jgi:alkylation response protein AidB-like acyl-CoA dehydrogenase